MSTPLIEVPEHIHLLSPYDTDGPGVEFIRLMFSVIGVSGCNSGCLCERQHPKSRRWQRATREPLAPAAPVWTSGGTR